MNYIELIVSILITFIMFINILFSYFKGVKKSQISLLITICFYALFIITSIFLDGSFLLPVIKEKLKITNIQYDNIIIFISNIILKILYFLLLYFLSIIIERIVTRKNKNQKDLKATFIGFLKGFIHVIILLCILNYNIKTLPSYNKENEGIYEYIKIENKEKLITLINDYKEGKLIDVTDSFDEKVTQIMSYSYFDNELVSLNIELLNIIELANKVKNIDEITYQSIYELILIADKCDCLDTFKNFLSLYIKDVDINNISLEKEIDIIKKIIDEINSGANINLITSYLYDLESLDYIVYVLLDNINISILNENILNDLKKACLNKYIHKDIYLINNLYEYYTFYLIDKDISTLINNNEFINELFKSKFVNFVFPKVLSYINEIYELNLNLNVINDFNISKEASIIIPLAYNVYKGENVFDKKLLDNVLNSELLSQLLIKSIIDSTYNKGFLAKYNKYIDVPLYLLDINSLNWENELPIIVNLFKNIDFNDQYIIDSIINNININDALKSDVVYYSLSKILLNNKYLIFSFEDILNVDNKILIDKEEIIHLFDLLTQFKHIKYQDILNLSFKNIDYNKISFKKLLENETIRNSLSNLLINFNIPNDTFIEKCVYSNGKKSLIKQIKENELYNIIDLFKKINIANISTIDQIFEVLINNKDIIINYLTYGHSSYSKIIHDNISSFIINQIKMLPEINVKHIIEKYENLYIEPEEIINIVQTLFIFKQNNIDFENGYTEDMIKKIFDVVINNTKILDSYIVKDIIDQYMKLYM